MKLKGFDITYHTAKEKLQTKDGIIETNDKEAIKALKLMGFEEVKEAKKEPKKK
jgi:hypothetical protein